MAFTTYKGNHLELASYIGVVGYCGKSTMRWNMGLRPVSETRAYSQRTWVIRTYKIEIKMGGEGGNKKTKTGVMLINIQNLSIRIQYFQISRKNYILE